MAIITPPTIDPVPTPVPHRGDPANFSSAMDANVDWQAAAPPQFGAVADNVVHNATEAMNSATAAAASTVAAAGQATIATTQAGNAATQAGIATTQAGIATTKAAEAAGSAAAAAASALSLIANSSTTLAIGVGTRVFTIPAGKQYQNGEPVSSVSVGTPTAKMFGTVADYTGTALTVTMTDFEGSGSYSDWVISPSGARGPTGSISGGNLSGALNEAKGPDIASVTTLDIWSGAGNYEVVTGTATITGFAAAPQAGARRRLLAGGTPTFTAGANMVLKGVPSGQSYVATAGDEFEVVAETSTKFRITIFRADGAAAAGLYGAFQNARRISTSGSFTATKTGWHRITLTGSAGRGGNVLSPTTSGIGATGGGAPGFCVGMRFLIAGQTYTVIVASGVVSFTRSSGTFATAGVAGSSTSFSGAGTTLTANGGGAGNATLSGGTLAGATGGTASGGDINVTGGASGGITGLVAGSAAATGGGAVGVQGVGYSSGSIAAGATSNSTGGAGVGGASGTATGTLGVSGGGGSGGPSPNASGTSGAGGPNWEGVAAGPVVPAGGLTAIMNTTGGGTNAGDTGASNSGGGTGGVRNTVSSDAGEFAGSGGGASDSGVGSSGPGGKYGGASGGAAGTGAPIVTGATQGGLALIEF